MRVCELSDFISRDYKVDKNFAGGVKKRLCPDITKENKDHFMIRNLYSNHQERLNFAIEIYLCKNIT